MLKIYLHTVEYEIHNEDKITYLNTYSKYVIKEEGLAVTQTIELDAYSDKAHSVYPYTSGVKQKKKGKKSYFCGWPSDVYLKEWEKPNAKLVMHSTYKEDMCSMRQLITLPADQVIAYLKQEGINPLLTN